MPFVTNPGLLWMFVPVLGFVAFGYTGAMNTLIPEQVDSYYVGIVVGLFLIVSQLANVVQPIVIGRILDVVSLQYSYVACFTFLGAGAILGAILVLGAKETNK